MTKPGLGGNSCTARCAPSFNHGPRGKQARHVATGPVLRVPEESSGVLGTCVRGRALQVGTVFHTRSCPLQIQLKRPPGMAMMRLTATVQYIMAPVAVVRCPLMLLPFRCRNTLYTQPSMPLPSDMRQLRLRRAEAGTRTISSYSFQHAASGSAAP
jgi:hypothetical protein